MEEFEQGFRADDYQTFDEAVYAYLELWGLANPDCFVTGQELAWKMFDAGAIKRRGQVGTVQKAINRLNRQQGNMLKQGEKRVCSESGHTAATWRTYPAATALAAGF